MLRCALSLICPAILPTLAASAPKNMTVYGRAPVGAFQESDGRSTILPLRRSPLGEFGRLSLIIITVSKFRFST